MHRTKTIALSLLLALVAARATPAGAAKQQPPWKGKVVGVADGDTITVLREGEPVKVRLHGIDAPEKSQPFGQRAKQLASKLAFGKVVTVRGVTTDRYGRTVAEVLVGDRSLNEAMVGAGLAWWYRRYARRAKVLAVLEEDARKARRGLWIDKNPTAPWDFRHRGKGFSGNVRSRVFHAPGCRHYRCKSCTARFKTAAAALAAGYRPHRACVERRVPRDHKPR